MFQGGPTWLCYITCLNHSVIITGPLTVRNTARVYIFTNTRCLKHYVVLFGQMYSVKACRYNDRIEIYQTVQRF